MRPIDADALLEQLAKVVQRADENAAYTGNRDSGLTWDMAVEYIKNAPTIELKRKEGRWIDIDAETYMWMIKCDKCGHLRSMMSTNGIYPKFCENCGAEMKGE